MIYLLDANVISDLVTAQPEVVEHLEEAILRGDTVGICHPIYYEILRGLLWRPSKRKMYILQNKILPQMDWIDLKPVDWLQTAQMWATARRKGWNLSDIDVLLAAIAHRLNAVVVTSDADFDILPISRENWR